MSFGFRVCFILNGEGSLTSDEEFISFVARKGDIPLKLSSGTAGVSIGKTDRFSISGGSFDTAEDAQAAAEKVRVALLRRATAMRQGIDLGQQALKSFGMSAYGKQYIAELFKVHAVQEDHLGITVFRDDPKPKFVRMNATALVSSQAQALVDDLSAAVGRYKFTTEKSEIAAGIYAISHFVGRAPARFLLLFVSLEALFKPMPRSDVVQNHVQSLIATTVQAKIPTDERDAIASALTFLKSRSIAQTGRELAATLLEGQTYEGMDAATFFSHIYRMRNDIVHQGKIEPGAVHSILGEFDRFVSELISRQYVEL
jgi:hypothetical protein